MSAALGSGAHLSYPFNVRTFCGFTGYGSAAAAWLAVAFTACSSQQFTAGSDTDHGGTSSGGESAQAGSAGQSSADAGAPSGDAGAPSSSSGGDTTGGEASGGGTGGEDVAGSAGSGGALGGGAGNGAGGSAGASAGSGGSGGGTVVPKVKAYDDFVADAQGWTVTGDVSTAMPAVYSGGGGNPNGSISWVDGGGGIWFFMAPKKYLGDDSAYYGGVLKFDLKVTEITMLYKGTDVELTSDALTLAYDCTPDPTYTKYTTYTVPLKETGWKVETLSGAAVTAAQFKQVLSKLTRLRIRGEFNTGADTGHLDNVYLGLN